MTQSTFEFDAEPPSPKTCDVKDCEIQPRSPRARWCEKHYMRAYRTGGTWARSDGWPQDCEVCGVSLVPRTSGGKAKKYCGPQCRQVAARAHNYGLTVREYLALYHRREGGCHICGRNLRLPIGGDRPGGRRIDIAHVDHDHDTGRVRGMLCAACNSAVGHLDDDPTRAEALARYLRSWRDE